MTVDEALEAMRTGISVVSFRGSDTAAREMLTLVFKDKIEMFLAGFDTTKPTEIYTEAQFLAIYSNDKFIAYNI